MGDPGLQCKFNLSSFQVLQVTDIQLPANFYHFNTKNDSVNTIDNMGHTVYILHVSQMPNAAPFVLQSSHLVFLDFAGLTFHRKHDVTCLSLLALFHCLFGAKYGFGNLQNTSRNASVFCH